MAVRVKKLARELETSPQRLLLLLGAVGYDRYRTENDMVADGAARKVRSYVADLRRSGEFSRMLAPSPPAPSPPAPAPAPSAQDPIDQDQLLRHLDRPLDEVIEQAPEPSSDPLLAEAAQALREERRRIEAQARRLAERQSELAEQTRSLEAQRAGLQQERAELRAELEEARRELRARAADLDAIEAGGTPLSALLEERGLRGPDEQGRALAALASARMLDVFLPRLRVVDSLSVRRMLAERLVLAGGPLDGIEGLAVVQVAPDRAEVPPPDEMGRLCDRLWGEFLLCGLKRVTWVGLSTLEQRLLKQGLDPRLTVRFLPARRREGATAQSDLKDSDVVLLRAVTTEPDADEVYGQAQIPVLNLESTTLVGLVAETLEALGQL